VLRRRRHLCHALLRRTGALDDAGRLREDGLALLELVNLREELVARVLCVV
jgi:hypothetical protein